MVQAAAQELGLVNVETVHARAEDMAKTRVHREHYDLVVSRAVANMATLSEYCLPFVKKGGYFIAYKTEEAMDEIKAAERAISLLGGKIEKIVPGGIECSGHIFAVVKKERTTPSKYPRKAGLPSKSPL